MILPILAALLAGPAATPAPAAAAGQEQPSIIVNGKKKRWDPERVVCREIQEPGSRLATQRVCQTMLQWASEKRENQQLLSQKQYNGAQ